MRSELQVCGVWPLPWERGGCKLWSEDLVGQSKCRPIRVSSRLIRSSGLPRCRAVSSARLPSCHAAIAFRQLLPASPSTRECHVAKIVLKSGPDFRAGKRVRFKMPTLCVGISLGPRKRSQFRDRVFQHGLRFFVPGRRSSRPVTHSKRCL